jgi:hypothetical protein
MYSVFIFLFGEQFAPLQPPARAAAVDARAALLIFFSFLL